MSTTGATIAWTAVTAIGFISLAYERSAGQNLLLSVSPAAGTQYRSRQHARPHRHQAAPAVL